MKPLLHLYVQTLIMTTDKYDRIPVVATKEKRIKRQLEDIAANNKGTSVSGLCVMIIEHYLENRDTIQLKKKQQIIK